jgi:pyruvate/2-oxoglutarate dehydrogenase complex dihydrolipoamide dehydrogenase (E3) component
MTESHVRERHRSEEHTVPANEVGEVDVVVIGGGPTGESLAARTVQGGLSTVVVEADLLGGDCLYWACMPSKALLRPLHALAAARRVPGAREAVTGSINAAAVFEYRNSFTSTWDDSPQVQWAVGANIRVVRGYGRLAGDKRVEVTTADGATATITARHAVVVATASTPFEPAIEGLADTPHWGSREATSAKEVPARLVVLGGGVVGVEMAQAFARLGSAVTMLTPSGVLSRMGERVGQTVGQALAQDGVDVRIGTRISRVSREGADGPVTVTVADGQDVVADELLVATGRRPNSGDVGLQSVGLEPGQALEVDTTGLVKGVDGGWLYAAGDVTGQAPLTHMGKYSARATGDVIAARAQGLPVQDQPWGKHATTAHQRAVPQVMFTDPEVTTVGLSAADAEQAGYRTRVVDVDIAVAGAAIHAQDYTGWAQMVVDEDRHVIVGMTIVGQDVADLLHSATIAIVGEVPLERLWHAAPSFPTISEVWLKLLEAYGL